jgi:hypothetical protein
LERSDFLARCTFEIHTEPQHGNHYSRHAGGDVLGYLSALFAGKFANPNVIRFYFGNDHRTNASRVDSAAI